jgi:hypothetical protein
MTNRKFIAVIGLVVGLLIGALPLGAQETPKEVRISPHETVSAVIGDGRVTVVYGRPRTADPKTGKIRTIWGGLVPYGEIWRTGADEATLLITQKTLSFGGTSVPAGAYTLWTLPSKDGAKLIVNKQIGQWGTGPGSYDAGQDLARIDLKKEALKAPVSQFTIDVSGTKAGDGVLKMEWEGTEFSVGFKVGK